MTRPPLPVGSWGEVTVSALPNGRYRARTRFRDFDGVTRQVERTGRTRGAARNALTTALTDRAAPAGDELTGSSTFATVAEVWYAEVETAGRAENTVRRYREVLDDHVLPAVGALRLSECTTGRLDRFLKTKAETVGGPTAKLCRTVLSGVLGLAVRHDAIRTNPVDGVAGITATPKNPARALTVDEIRALREAVRQWQHGTPIDGKAKRGRPPTQDLLDIVDLLLATGARIGELLAIRWADVDLEAGKVTITGTIISTREKPRRLIRQEHPKTSSGWRRLSLPKFALDNLMRRRVAVTVANVHDVVFPSTAGTLRDPASVRKQLDKVLTPAGLGWVTPKTFRKTVATVLDREADIRTAADQLGHAGTETARRHYIQLLHEGPDARRYLEDLLSGDR